MRVVKSDPWDTEATTSAGVESPVPSLRRPGKKPFALQLVQGPGAPREFLLDLEEVVVGRSLQVHISIDSHLISRRHASLKKNGSEYVISDLDSKNGMYLNGVRAHSAVLREGDTIQIGDIVMVYSEGS